MKTATRVTGSSPRPEKISPAIPGRPGRRGGISTSYRLDAVAQGALLRLLGSASRSQPTLSSVEPAGKILVAIIDPAKKPHAAARTCRSFPLIISREVVAGEVWASVASAFDRLDGTVRPRRAIEVFEEVRAEYESEGSGISETSGPNAEAGVLREQPGGDAYRQGRDVPTPRDC